MRRRITLYIGGERADLDDGSFLLFNYTAEDTDSPAVVRNSFSRTVTLPGTPRNNAIFGSFFRLDRVTQYGIGGTGVDFDPTQKTPFVIYDEAGQVLESGYLKLDRVKGSGASAQYACTLYGGLGSFFYSLAYDAQGNKRSLADLDFLGTADPATEMNFTINRANIAAAWARLGGDDTAPALWDVLNFAPCYNGRPGGSFDADKALIHAESAGLLTSDEEGRATRGGFVLASLTKDYTDWEMHDLRSYLQRPVLRVKALFAALSSQANNGGWTVNLDPAFFNADNPYYEKAWLTLPVLNTLDVEITEASGNLSWALGSAIIIPGGGNASANYKVAARFRPAVTPATAQTAPMYLHCFDQNNGSYLNVIRYRITGYDALDNVLAVSTVHVSSMRVTRDGVPTIDFLGHFDATGAWVGEDVIIGLEAQGLHHIVIERTALPFAWDNTHGGIGDAVWTNTAYYNSIVSVTAFGQGNVVIGYSSRTSGSARSGSVITKGMLLKTKATPAEYLLSFAKMFNLRFLCDKATKTVSILARSTFFNGVVEDLSRRVDHTQEPEKQPLVFDQRWYDWALPVEGEFADYYANVYGRQYGVHRVNTAYAFNADVKDVLEGSVYRGACEVLAVGKYFVDFTLVGGPTPVYHPAIFLDQGGTYALYASDGKTEDYPLPVPPSTAIWTWWNAARQTYDAFSKAQFHDKDGKGLDTRDTLLFFDGVEDVSGLRLSLTDDTPLMMALNSNTPCWLPDACVWDEAAVVAALPRFSRYVREDGEIVKSWDMGTPLEVAIPGAVFADDSGIFPQYWASYIADRYDDDTAVMTCRVNLAGIQVGEDLLRRFWWYGGALWALNKISNYSMTTWDLTDCEFVKVQDPDNYTE